MQKLKFTDYLQTEFGNDTIYVNETPFLGKDGLTSTSANAIANKAKEMIKDISIKLKNINFITEKSKIISSNAQTDYIVNKKGLEELELANIKSYIYKIVEYKSLIAWLREAIKFKECRMEYIRDCVSKTTFAKYYYDHLANEKEKAILKDERYWERTCKRLGFGEINGNSCDMTKLAHKLNTNELCKFIENETRAAIIGKYVHNDGELANARNEMFDRQNKPHEMIVEGDFVFDKLYECELDSKLIENLYFDLQSAQREAQSQTNKAKFEVKETLTQAEIEARIKIENYQATISELNSKIRTMFETEKKTIIKAISQEKILIPNRLKEIYEFVSGY